MAIGLSHSGEDTLARTIGAVYDAAVTPERWPDAMLRVRECFNTASTAYLVHNADRTRIDRVTAEYDPEGQRANVDILLRGSVAYTQGPKGYSGQIIRVAQLVPEKLFQRTRMYEEYWRPRELYDGIRLTIAVDGNGTHHALNLLRPRSSRRFDDGDLVRAHALMPSLRHAVAIRQRLHEVDLLAAAALTALDVLRHAILLLDHNGRVLHANASGAALLREADGLGARHGMLFAATPTLTGRLHALLARAAGLGGRPEQAGALRLHRARGGALAALAMPFRQEAHWSLSPRPVVLLCVTDPHAVASVPCEELAALFGLTRAEAALAADLLAGRELREIADARGRSVNTLRSHLAKLMAKTNVGRQSELMRLLASLPRLPEQV